MEPVVVCQKLCKRYKTLQAVDTLSLEIRAGEIYGFLGLNGAGKTTTIRMLCGLLPPTSGDAWITGASISGDRSKVNNAVRLTNPAPYALYVHPKGTPKTRTIVNYDIRRELLPEFALQMVEDVDRVLRPQIARALKAKILAEAAR